MKAKAISYWTTTILLAFIVLSGGLAELLHRKDNVEGILRLGYPMYFITLLGVWKLLGGLVILLPRMSLLKEWAYAGIFFNLSGAFVSHAASNDAPFHLVATGLFTILTIASWSLRPPTRKLQAASSQNSFQPAPLAARPAEVVS